MMARPSPSATRGATIARAPWLASGVALNVVLLACGTIGGDILDAISLPDAQTGDGAPSDPNDGAGSPSNDAASTPADAAALAPDGAPSTTAQLDQALGPWGSVEPITPIAELASKYYDDDPTLTADLLELYFTSTRTGSTDIYFSKRATPDGVWSPPALATPLSTSDDEDTPEIAPDGLTIWFVRNVKGTNSGRDVYVSTRATRNAPWSAGKLVPELSSSSEDYAPTPSADGLSMVLSSYRKPTIGADDFFSSNRASIVSAWTTPRWVPVIESTARDTGPFRPGDDTLIYFTTWRSGVEIWRATRADASQSWGAPTAVSELSPNAYGAEEPWISSDMHLIVFVTRPPTGPTQLAEARR